MNVGAQVQPRIMQFGEKHNDRLQWLMLTAKTPHAFIIVSCEDVRDDLVDLQNLQANRGLWPRHMFTTPEFMREELARQPRMLQKHVYDFFVFDPPAVYKLLDEQQVRAWMELMGDPASSRTFVF